MGKWIRKSDNELTKRLREEHPKIYAMLMTEDIERIYRLRGKKD